MSAGGTICLLDASCVSSVWCITSVVQDGSELHYSNIAAHNHHNTIDTTRYLSFIHLCTHTRIHAYFFVCWQARAAAAVDHVADLLRTEPVAEPVLIVPNYSKVEALGVVADSALKSIRMPDLSELCKLPRPVAPIVTMVKGVCICVCSCVFMIVYDYVHTLQWCIGAVVSMYCIVCLPTECYLWRIVHIASIAHVNVHTYQ
jgi:hypothetical protein